LGGNSIPERSPKVIAAHEFLEITRDFTDPKDVLREAISNSLDWHANQIYIKVTEDRTHPEEELVIEIKDDGIGITEDRLKSFFDLGNSIPGPPGSRPQIGNKGHGTKTYYNSRRIEVDTKVTNTTIHAVMTDPLQKLMTNEIPTYRYALTHETNEHTGTAIRILHYNMSKNKRDFGHRILKDYVRWKTKFGSVEKEFGVRDYERKMLMLQGLGRNDFEQIPFGHVFPAENCNIEHFRRTHQENWSEQFCKRWIFPHHEIIGNPGKFIDMVFYVEGDEAKRSYNDMIRTRRPFDYGMYKVEDRYGLWVCKDYIPIKRYNEWLGLGKRLETKYHAFVNCQDFRLTANRGDVGNTPPDLLTSIAETVRQIFENDIIRSNTYQEYDDAVRYEEQYQTAQQETKDFDRRRRRALSKNVCNFEGLELIEPAMEMGVVALFNLVRSRHPEIFPFNIIDYDTKRGYDALVSRRDPRDLTRDTMFFLEFKYKLDENFNHAFSHLEAIVCWDCVLFNDQTVTDIEGSSLHLRITPGQGPTDYKHYILQSNTGTHNVEVFVLKDYLREKLHIEFRPRAAGTRNR
jgi:hypothetical protein